MRVFLVRHGQSHANLDWSENTRNADMSINLTQEGHAQAKGAGEFLAGYFTKHLLATGALGSFIPKVRLWHSPYNRTRQTAQEIFDACVLPQPVTILGEATQTPSLTVPHHWPKRATGDSFFWDKKEHFLLYEQQHGIDDGLDDDERKAQYPEEWAYYQKHKRDGGKVFAQLPLGESRIDVAQRIHQAFGTFHRDADKHGIEDIVVVGHGTTNRCFMFAWLHKTYEWLEKEPNPLNCSVRLIEDGEDKGYIYEGAEHPDGFIHDHAGSDGERVGG